MANEKANKAAPEKKEKKENFFKRTWKKFTSWLRGMKSELKKVVWPSASQVCNNTLVVLVVMVVCAVVLWGFDYVASLGVRLLINIGA